MCSLPQSLIGKDSNFNTIYLFSETRCGYREAELSDGRFKHARLLNSFLLDHFSVFCLRLQSVVQKSFGWPQLATVNGDFTFLFFCFVLF